MATIADELNAISVEHGYTGAAPKTIAGAIDALADTLAGTDVEGKRTIAGAVKALAPYIGSGGGGAALGELADVSADDAEIAFICVSTMPYDITSGETPSDVVDSIYNNTNVLRMNGNAVKAPSGCYVVVRAEVSDDWTTDNLGVYDGSHEQQITSGFECRAFDEDLNVFFTMQIPADGLSVSWNDGGGDVG